MSTDMTVVDEAELKASLVHLLGGWGFVLDEGEECAGEILELLRPYLRHPQPAALPSKQLVERVARAMWAERQRFSREVFRLEVEDYDHNWGSGPVAEANNILGEAEAALKAMQEGGAA